MNMLMKSRYSVSAPKIDFLVRSASLSPAGDSEAERTKKSIFGALTLYLDFINMFMFILHLFGNRE